MNYIEERHKKIIIEVLNKYPYKFYVFGSRAKGVAKKFSDLDICFFDDIPWNIRAHIEEDFEESNLPYTVDMVDWNMCDDSFKQIIKREMIPIDNINSHNSCK